MTRLIGAFGVLALVIGFGGPVSAAGAEDANAVLDKAIKALGGEAQLAKAKTASWKTKGTIAIMGADNEITSSYTIDGLDHFRQEFESEFGGNKIKGMTILAGDKGSRDFNDMHMELDKDALANTKRTVYLAIVPMTILPLKGKEFKVESIADEMVGGKPAAGLQVTAPDKKDFKIYFDKESGLPVKTLATVAGLQGGEVIQETIYSDYKEMAGIKKATKVKATRNGAKFIEQEVTEFKVLDKVDPKTFTDA
jgi:hypothetical protein